MIRMSHRVRGYFAAFLSLAIAAAAFGQKNMWVYEHGNWEQQTQAVPQPVSDPVIGEAEQLLVRNDTDGARKILFAWEHEHKDSPVRDRCLWEVAQSYYEDDDRIYAFYYLDELMDEYPESPLFNSALDKQYSIAADYLAGHKRRFFGFPVLAAEDEAVEMLYRVQQRSPGSALAEKALLLTAAYYYNSGQFDYAADTYAAYVRSYPRGQAVMQARMRSAFATLAQFHGLLFDATPLIDARAQLLDFARSYPQRADEENVTVFVSRIDSAFAGKLLATGDFYNRTSQPRAAAYFFRFLADTYPDTSEGRTAVARLAFLPNWAKGPPLPPRASGYAPATEPSQR
jgi:outer membrane protein assembly factor BamD (BamD/ComL family)